MALVQCVRVSGGHVTSTMTSGLEVWIGLSVTCLSVPPYFGAHSYRRGKQPFALSCSA